ncbi:CRISPR-associated endoribonuclease Cas6 [Anaerovorax odorimutans]|uniref:CRISPR-associated endoribonuclease Cas6 n=1 Tax=Anaerovorax odorimutans TaxID=109327 RepID=A0ABT1RL98_9FIRM|nr:CRISPR-associated endoribonuclease Cas6 [Anaerovorax odorimutans]
MRLYLLDNIPYPYTLAAIAEFVDKALCADERWKQYHQENHYKQYSFSSLCPISKSGIYEKDTLRTFTLRTLDADLAEYLVKTLPHIETSKLKGLIAEVWTIPQKPIEKLYSLNPVIIKCEEGNYWKENNFGFQAYQKRIFVNLIKKWNFFLKEKLEEDFDLWTRFELKNNKPIAFPYKGIKLLGDKIEMQIADNQPAQNLAYLALATGLGEMGSRGAGYVNYRPIKGV